MITHVDVHTNKAGPETKQNEVADKLSKISQAATIKI